MCKALAHRAGIRSPWVAAQTWMLEEEKEEEEVEEICICPSQLG